MKTIGLTMTDAELAQLDEAVATVNARDLARAARLGRRPHRHSRNSYCVLAVAEAVFRDTQGKGHVWAGERDDAGDAP